MKNIVIFGAPGSGKGTQSDLMIKKYGFGHISTGDVLRNEIKNETELGKTAKQYIDKGQLIPDELMVSILASVYDSFGKEHKGVILRRLPPHNTAGRGSEKHAQRARTQNCSYDRARRSRGRTDDTPHQTRSGERTL